NSGAQTADRIFLGNVPATQTGTGTAAGILNIGSGTAGGTVTTGRVQAGGDVAQATTTRIVNFNGGLLKVKGGTAFAGTFMTGLTSANVYAGGATVDTNGVDATIDQPLVAPTGNGVTGISVVDGGSGYRVAPIVNITGGGGTGATAVAAIDSTGKVSAINITNPGTGYTGTPTVQLFANGGTSLTAVQTPYGGTAATLSVATGALST